MENIVRTVYGAVVQTSLLTGTPIDYAAFTTLNEKFGIQATTLPTQLQRPVLGYLVVGNGGHLIKTGADSTMVPVIVQHKTTDSALFRHMPLVLRETNDDLTAPQQQNYALRKLENHDGIDYYAYYAKRLTLSNTVVQMELKTVSGGITTTVPFVPNSSNMNPIPVVVPPGGANSTSGSYVTATDKINIEFTDWEIAEYLNVAKVIYGDDDFAIISEIGLCTGVDKPAGTFNEVIGCQIATHLGCYYAMKQLQNGLDILVDVGVTEPLYNITPITP